MAASSTAEFGYGFDVRPLRSAKRAKAEDSWLRRFLLGRKVSATIYSTQIADT
jgi:hypothetical protein